MPCCLFSQATKRSAPRTNDGINAEFAAAQSRLENAKASGDSSEISSASRTVISLALRLVGTHQLLADSRPSPTDTFRRAVDFDDSSSAHADLAAACLLSGQIDEALSEANNVVLRDPRSARAWHVQGRAWMVKRNYGQAITALKQSISLQPNPAVSRALSQAKLRKPVNAPLAAREFFVAPGVSESGLRRALASALNDLGTTEARQEQFSLAWSHFREAERWDPQTPGLTRNLGLSAARIPDYAEAERALRMVVNADPNDRVARTMLGTALFSTGKFADSAQVLSALGDSVFDTLEVAYTLASAQVKVNRYSEASSILDKLEARQISPGTLLLIAQTWSQMGNYARTVSACNRILQANPKMAGAHSLAGLALIRSGKPTEAEDQFRAELQLDPSDAESEYQLAFALLQQAKVEEAVQHLRSVLERRPDHPEANYELGKQLLTDGRPGDAIPYLETAARLKPQLEPVHYQLQAAYRSLGRKEDADREARIYREMKARSRNITLPPPPAEKTEATSPQ